MYGMKIILKPVDSLIHSEINAKSMERVNALEVLKLKMHAAPANLLEQ